MIRPVHEWSGGISTQLLPRRLSGAGCQAGIILSHPIYLYFGMYLVDSRMIGPKMSSDFNTEP